MSEIFNYINSNDIIHIDNYNNDISLFNFTDIKFRTYNSNYINFQVQLGITNDNKIISITNKQLSFLIQKYHHFLGHEYAINLKKNYEILKNEEEQNIIIVNEPVFQFFDYESVGSTGHMYDLMFHLLHYYKTNNLTSKLLVVESNNMYYNNLLSLIKSYFNVEYFYIKENKTYLFKHFSCVRSYQNIFFNQVKTFINKYLIEPIINKYDNLNEPYYNDIIKLKYQNPNNIDRTNSCFKKTELFLNFCKNRNIFDLNYIDNNEELKIYILNKANIIRIYFSSPYFININYYLQNTNNKFISIIFHSNNISDSNLFTQQDDIISQNMPPNYCGNITDQVYNNYKFKGEIIHNITNIDEYISRTTI
jgi:hypothetical protein